MIDVGAVRTYLLGLQGRIVDALRAEDGLPFRRDEWTRPPGGKLEGDGLTQVLEEGKLLERGGCNFSHVQGRGAAGFGHPAPRASSPARLSRRWASRWSCTRATPTCRRCT